MTPDEVVEYIDWQNNHDPTSMEGYLCSALDYFEFRYCQALDSSTVHSSFDFSANFSDLEEHHGHIAAICNHPLHPTDTQTNYYCPVCQVSILLDLQKVIADAWSKDGGPWPSLPGKQGDDHVALREAWHMARIEFENCLADLREMALEEAEYDSSHSDMPAAIENTYSHSRAITLAIAGTRYPAASDKNDIDPLLRLTPEPMEVSNNMKPKKSVRFADDTEFETSSRRMSYFDRRSSKYAPGKYAAPEGEMWQNTSFMFDDKYLIGQCKTFVVDMDSELHHQVYNCTLSNDKEVFDTLFTEIVLSRYSCHFDNIRRVFENHTSDEKVFRNVMKCMQDADGLLVLLENCGRIHTVERVSFPVDEEDLNPPEVVEGDWIVGIRS